jgi:hypothetical protein
MRIISCPSLVFSPGRVSALLSLALTSACSLPKMASDIVYYPPIAGSGEDMCRPVVRRVEHVDEPTELGFSAIEVLNHLAGASASPLVWLAPRRNDQYTLVYGPERGASQLSLSVEPAPGEILYRYRVPLDGAPEDTECEPGHLEIPVEVTMQSQAGALDETFATTLEARESYRGSFHQTFDPGTLAGGLQFSELSSLDPERSFVLGPLTLEVVLWQGGSQGSLRARVDSRYAAESKKWRPLPEAAPEPDALALWPSVEACDEPFQHLPSDAKLIGFSARDVLAALQARGNPELEWSDGSATLLRLDFAELPAGICQAPGDRLQFDAAVRVRTDDGRLDTRFPVRVVASAQRGMLREIAIHRGGPAEMTEAEDSGELESSNDSDQTELEGNPDLEPLPGAIAVELDATYQGRDASGSIAIRRVARTTQERTGIPVRDVIQTGRW